MQNDSFLTSLRGMIRRKKNKHKKKREHSLFYEMEERSTDSIELLTI